MQGVDTCFGAHNRIESADGVGSDSNSDAARYAPATGTVGRDASAQDISTVTLLMRGREIAADEFARNRGVGATKRATDRGTTPPLGAQPDGKKALNSNFSPLLRF